MKFPNTHIASMGQKVLYIYIHEWLIFIVNGGKYTSPMDPKGIGKPFSGAMRQGVSGLLVGS